MTKKFNIPELNPGEIRETLNSFNAGSAKVRFIFSYNRNRYHLRRGHRWQIRGRNKRVQ